MVFTNPEIYREVQKHALRLDGIDVHVAEHSPVEFRGKNDPELVRGPRQRL